ncbi:MAG: hypothetical protein V1913_11185 [Fibrobacterota bacterium]
MKAIWTGLLTAVSLLLLASGASGELTDPRFDREITAGLDCVMRAQYDSAMARFQEMSRKTPSSPAGEFFKSVCITARYYDLHDTSSFQLCHRSLDRVLLLTEGRRDPLSIYYRASAYALLSVMLMHEDRKLAAALMGRKSAEIFRGLLEGGTISGDALGMLGSYHYWSSFALKSFSWLPFISDQREQGLRELRKGQATARTMRFALTHSLLWIDYDTFALDEALALCNSVLADYPANPVFRQIKLHILYRKGAYSEALALARPLLEEYRLREEVPVNRIAVTSKTALILYALGRKDEADALAKPLLAAKYDSGFRQRIQKELSDLRKNVK